MQSDLEVSDEACNANVALVVQKEWRTLVHLAVRERERERGRDRGGKTNKEALSEAHCGVLGTDPAWFTSWPLSPDTCYHQQVYEV